MQEHAAERRHVALWHRAKDEALIDLSHFSRAKIHYVDGSN
jgi:hypothetical protein